MAEWMIRRFEFNRKNADKAQYTFQFCKSIICSDYSQLKTGSAQSGKSVLLNKKANENFVSVHVNSPVIGSLDFECSGLLYEGAKEIALFNSDTRQWEWNTDSFDQDSYFQFDSETD